MDPEVTANRKVAHNFSDLKEGEEIILTLKDQRILDDKGEIIEEDVLENFELAQLEKKEHHDMLKSKIAVQQYQDDQSIKNKSVLSKYDDIVQQKDGFVINEEGEIQKDAKQQLEIIKMKLKNKGSSKPMYNQETNYNVIANEYLEETEQEKKKKKKGFQKRLKQNKENKQNIADYLEENLDLEKDQDHIENHGNRQDQKSKRKNEQLQEDYKEKKQKIENYELAVENANAQSKQAQQNKWNNFIDNDDTEQQLLESIEQQRKRKADQKQEKPEDQLQNLLQENLDLENQIKEKEKQEREALAKVGAPKPKIKGQKNVEFITELSGNQDFLKQVDTDEQVKFNQKMEQMQQSSIGDTKTGTTSIVQVSLPSERQRGWKRRQEELENQVPDMTIKLTEKELQELREENKILEDQSLGTGLSAALQRLREQGALLEETDWVGRNLDKKSNINKEDDRIKLDYRDESGKQMTSKEAFRYLCHQFHGKGVSKTTLEKKQRKILQKEQQRQKYTQSETLLMETLKKSQQQSGQAHMVINFNKSLNTNKE